MARENRVMQTQLIRNQTFSFGKKEKSGFVCTLQQEKKNITHCHIYLLSAALETE